MSPVCKYLNVTMRQRRKHDIPIVECDSELAVFLVFGSECAIIPAAVRAAYTYTSTYFRWQCHNEPAAAVPALVLLARYKASEKLRATCLSAECRQNALVLDTA